MDCDLRRSRRKATGQRLGSRIGPIDDTDSDNAGIDKRRYNCASRTTGSKYYCRAHLRTPIRDSLAKVFAKTKRIGIASLESPVLPNDDGVHSADSTRQRFHLIEHRESGLLMRYRQVTASEAKDRQ